MYKATLNHVRDLGATQETQGLQGMACPHMMCDAINIGIVVRSWHACWGHACTPVWQQKRPALPAPLRWGPALVTLSSAAKHVCACPHYGSSAAQIVLPQAWRVLPRLCTVCAFFKGVVAPELTGPIINKPDGISAIAQQLQLLAQAVQQGPAPDMCLHGGCLTPQGGACWCGKLRQRLHSCRAHYRCMMAALRPALFWGHHCITWQTS